MPSSILHAAVVARKLVGRHYQRYAQPTPSLRLKSDPWRGPLVAVSETLCRITCQHRATNQFPPPVTRMRSGRRMIVCQRQADAHTQC